MHNFIGCQTSDLPFDLCNINFGVRQKNPEIPKMRAYECNIKMFEKDKKDNVPLIRPKKLTIIVNKICRREILQREFSFFLFLNFI